MSRNLDDLTPELKSKVELLIANCKARGIVMVPYYTLRTPQEQGKLWRQGRSTFTINTKIEELRNQKCDFIADCIENAGPQNGSKVTNALPGQSKHSYGLACDLYWEKDKGVASWSPNAKNENGLNGYRVMHEEALKVGLKTITLGVGEATTDWPHVELDVSVPKGIKNINKEMKKKFG